MRPCKLKYFFLSLLLCFTLSLIGSPVFSYTSKFTSLSLSILLSHLPFLSARRCATMIFHSFSRCSM